MNAEDLKQRYHLGPQDLPDPKGLNPVQITGVETEYYPVTENGQRIEKFRHLLRLNGYRVPLRLNNTRIDVLTALLGKDTDAWIGRKIGLYAAAHNSYGETKVSIFIHLEACDHLPALPAPKHVAAAGGGAFKDEIRGAMAKWNRPPSSPAAPPTTGAPPAPGAAPVSTAFDVRPIGEKNSAAFRAAMAEQGIGLDDVLAWLKRHDQETHDRVWGQELADWPRGVGPAMQKCLRLYPEEARRAAAPVAPAQTTPSPSAAAAATPNLSIKPGATYGAAVDPHDDIPF